MLLTAVIKEFIVHAQKVEVLAAMIDVLDGRTSSVEHSEQVRINMETTGSGCR